MCKITPEQGHAEVVEGTGGGGTPLPDLRVVRLRVGIEVTKKKDLWTRESSSA